MPVGSAVIENFIAAVSCLNPDTVTFIVYPAGREGNFHLKYLPTARMVVRDGEAELGLSRSATRDVI